MALPVINVKIYLKRKKEKNAQKCECDSFTGTDNGKSSRTSMPSVYKYISLLRLTYPSLLDTGPSGSELYKR
jgi:hypothetical protein